MMPSLPAIDMQKAYPVGSVNAVCRLTPFRMS
jgi:hypothetical protein